MAKYVKPNEAANTLGVCLRTLRRWEQEGKIKAVKTPSGQRRYDIMIRALRDGSFALSINSQSIAIAYALFVKGCAA